MFEDGSADLIYCSHGVEYFDRAQAANALREWRRVLKEGGILRLAVPDFQALVAVYGSTGNLDDILGPLFGRMAIRSGDTETFIYHRTVYDYRSLESLCMQAGFRSFRRYDWRETLHKNHDDFSQAYRPHMDKENGLLLSLNVEARK